MTTTTTMRARQCKLHRLTLGMFLFHCYLFHNKLITLLGSYFLLLIMTMVDNDRTTTTYYGNSGQQRRATMINQHGIAAMLLMTMMNADILLYNVSFFFVFLTTTFFFRFFHHHCDTYNVGQWQQTMTTWHSCHITTRDTRLLRNGMFLYLTLCFF